MKPKGGDVSSGGKNYEDQRGITTLTETVLRLKRREP